MPLNRPLAAALCLSLALPPGCATRDRYINDCPGTRAEAEECADGRARRANLRSWGTSIGAVALVAAFVAVAAAIPRDRDYCRRQGYYGC